MIFRTKFYKKFTDKNKCNTGPSIKSKTKQHKTYGSVGLNLKCLNVLYPLYVKSTILILLKDLNDSYTNSNQLQLE